MLNGECMGLEALASRIRHFAFRIPHSAFLISPHTYGGW